MLEAPYILLADDSDDDTYFAKRCFAAAGTHGGFGLSSTDEHLRSLGGGLTVESMPGRGTRVRIVVPIAATARTRSTERERGPA